MKDFQLGVLLVSLTLMPACIQQSTPIPRLGSLEAQAAGITLLVGRLSDDSKQLEEYALRIAERPPNDPLRQKVESLYKTQFLELQLLRRDVEKTAESLSNRAKDVADEFIRDRGQK